MTACSSDDNKQSSDFEPVAVEEILNGNLSGGDRVGIGQENRVIVTVVDWQELIDQIDYIEGGNESIIRILENVSIDFQQEEVLAVFEEVKTTGGYSIDITNVEEREKEVVVTIERLKKGGDDTVITQPFHIVKIPKINKSVVFVEVD
ncbi:protease complex subunit PrcB family protein [Myroides indicus]|uniref:Protease stability complex PrcB-like protein n=1 Tax=Myroides indicus TaxID=1323422 RepID=A0A4R7ER96_9FLAO|nr:protease complex subunit PrcB family protein [Myroides indicus]TDS55303.1 protease stability complex PrcB-like protein [Myroides indicus]